MRYFLLFSLVFFPWLTQAQTDLTYFLPQDKSISYNAEIPKPQEILGHEVGELHVTHDKLVFYLTHLARVSPRLSVDTIGFTYEKRPLIHLVITSPENHARLEEIREAHVALTDPSKTVSVTDQMPVVVWEGFSIHGNESSGSNAALLTAYYLAAAEGEAIQQTLSEAVIILDPCFNPDGLQRFAAWVNANKSHTQTADPNHRELNEPWPRGRTNHYWFDLNRDWLPVQQPESKARLAQFHRWKPNILTDHHEMGTNSTFFFQPGIPERTNPLTPERNQLLTGEIGEYHAKALDKIGSLYYSKESFDDFYYGKGSTYPDANGAIGILFEQASSRGHAQESQHGVLTFPFTIRNQFVTSLSTIEAGVGLRKELLEYQQEFFKNSLQEAKKLDTKGYLIGHAHDSVRLYHFAELLGRHQIKFYRPQKATTENGFRFTPQNSLVIPMDQAQTRLIQALFQQRTTFKDSLFYDVSAWTMHLAFGLQGAKVKDVNSLLSGEPLDKLERPKALIETSENTYAYLLDWRSMDAPAALFRLLKEGIQVKVAERPFAHEGETFPSGTMLISTTQNGYSATEIRQKVEALADKSVVVRALSTGLTDTGIDLGSPNFSSLSKPEVLLVTGDGVNSYEAGEAWHLLDYRTGIPVTLANIEDLNGIDFSRYTTIVMVNGAYNITGNAVNKLKYWISKGGTLICTKNAIQWANQQQILRSATLKNKKSVGFDTLGYRPYAMRGRDRGAQYIGGVILEAQLDLTSPLCFGYTEETIPVFRNSTLALDNPKTPYQVPIRYTKNPLLSGYISTPNLERLQNSPASLIESSGRGRTIILLDNPNFRAFWYGTNRLFLNAVFLGGIIE